MSPVNRRNLNSQEDCAMVWGLRCVSSQQYKWGRWWLLRLRSWRVSWGIGYNDWRNFPRDGDKSCYSRGSRPRAILTASKHVTKPHCLHCMIRPCNLRVGKPSDIGRGTTQAWCLLFLSFLGGYFGCTFCQWLVEAPRMKSWTIYLPLSLLSFLLLCVVYAPHQESTRLQRRPAVSQKFSWVEKSGSPVK